MSRTVKTKDDADKHADHQKKLEDSAHHEMSPAAVRKHHPEPCCVVKFKVDQLSGSGGFRQVVMSPVEDDPVNKIFFCGAAHGSIMFSVNGEETIKHFQEGGQYEVAFTKVEKE